MDIRIVKHININEGNRTEFLLVGFDYIDGNKIIAKLLCENFKMQTKEKFDGLFYSIVKVSSEDAEYNLIWHEDVGNYVVSKNQDEFSIIELEQRLDFVIKKLPH